MNAETVRSALRCGNNYCICYKGGNTHCPAHADNSPSLTITDGGDKLLYKCHAGCSQDKIIQALERMESDQLEDNLAVGQCSMSLEKVHIFGQGNKPRFNNFTHIFR